MTDNKNQEAVHESAQMDEALRKRIVVRLDADRAAGKPVLPAGVFRRTLGEDCSLELIGDCIVLWCRKRLDERVAIREARDFENHMSSIRLMLSRHEEEERNKLEQRDRELGLSDTVDHDNWYEVNLRDRIRDLEAERNAAMKTISGLIHELNRERTVRESAEEELERWSHAYQSSHREIC